MKHKKPIDQKRPKWPEQVIGGKYIRTLENLTRSLRGDDAHGNRELFLDDVVICYLLAFFNPSIRSLRTIDDFSQSQQAQRFISIDRIPKSTLSDFNKLADPTKLEPIVALLRAQAAKAQNKQKNAILPDTLKQVLAVDGSFFNVAADVAWAFQSKSQRMTKGGRPRKDLRLDVHVDVSTWVPEVISIANGESEADHACDSIVPKAIHVYDRGIFSFKLVEAHAEKQAHFVHRLREPGPRTPRFATEKSLPLIDADKAAGVISDGVGRLAGSTHRDAPDRQYREVVIVSTDESGTQSEVRLLTDLMDIPAHIIGVIYRQRWQVELFFRWLKSCGRFGNIWSENRSGVLLEFYVVLIGLLVMYVRTGLRPSKYAMIMLGMVVAGTATWAEIQPIIARRSRERDLERERLARKKTSKPP